MYQFALMCLILCMGLQYAAGNPVTDYAYNREADAWLRLHTEPAAFWDAHHNCQREGGGLASPTNYAMVQTMLSAMADDKLMSVFAGIAPQAKGDKSQTTFSNASLKWAADELCLALTGAGALTPVSCARALPYFCRKDSAHSCGNGYEYEPRTGSCYKFHRVARAFRPALATCHAEGGVLAVINGPTESCVLRDIFHRIPPATISGTDDRKHVLVGFRKYEDGQWATIYGETLDEAGFSQWSEGEPNNAGGDEYCGSIFTDGLLNDISCTRRLAFFCEKSP